MLAAVESQAILALGVVAAGPAHQGVNFARIGMREFQNPALCFGGARLHGVTGGLVNAHEHRIFLDQMLCVYREIFAAVQALGTSQRVIRHRK
jgi:hypothetical protein